MILLMTAPFWFLLCRMLGSHTIRLGIPLIFAAVLLTGTVFLTLKNRNFPLLIGVVLIMPIFLSACVAFADFSFFAERAMIAKYSGNMPPSQRFFLGTDYEGRDILATIVIGGMNAYLVAALATIVALLTGIPSGLLLTIHQKNIMRGDDSFFKDIVRMVLYLIVFILFCLLLLPIFTYILDSFDFSSFVFSLIFAVASVALLFLLNGTSSGLASRILQDILARIASAATQFFEIVPQLFFVLIILGVFNFWAAGAAGTRLVAMYAVPMAGFAIGISSLPSVARIVENRVSQLQSQRFVVALRSSNVPGIKILLYNILWKNCLAEIVVQATFLFGAVILVESALGYAFEIGFGDLGTGGYLSWGRILAESKRSILFGENTWIVLFPIAVTIMSILGINTIGDILVKYLRSERT